MDFGAFIGVAEGRSVIVELREPSELVSFLEKVPENYPLFVDVDDTLITPRSLAFRTSPSKEMIDRLKASSEQYPNYKEILSQWRLQRKTILVDQVWPSVIEELKRIRPVYALTKMDTGEFGAIPSMEEWRFKELSEQGVRFSDSASLSALMPLSTHLNPPIFYKGIFITGSASKSEVLDLYKEVLWPAEENPVIVVVDDRRGQLEDIDTFCMFRGWKFLGLHYRGAEHLPGAPDPETSAFQEAYLLEHVQWLEDKEARECLFSSKNQSNQRVDLGEV